jgi:hypothetical protein
MDIHMLMIQCADPDKDVKQGLEVIRKVLLDMLERYSL